MGVLRMPPQLFRLDRLDSFIPPCQRKCPRVADFEPSGLFLNADVPSISFAIDRHYRTLCDKMGRNEWRPSQMPEN